jgi:pantoate--beta-alanine ligase
MRRPKVARTLRALDRARTEFDSATVALVPTMGALHAGHLALVRRARQRAERVFVSIFVNPTQFAPHEDLAAYPRTFAEDLAALAREGVDLVWAPSAEVMYPDGFATRVVPEGAAKVGLEDAFRPHFFGGVATVVAKLFLQCRPDFAFFGEKDFQQLKVVTRLARDLDLRMRVIGVATVREPDGLAMSSRNAYLTEAERAAAPVLYRTLKSCAQSICTGSSVAKALAGGRKAIAAAGFALDYLQVRNAETLAPLNKHGDEPMRLLVAARLGRTRLIDNIGV